MTDRKRTSAQAENADAYEPAKRRFAEAEDAPAEETEEQDPNAEDAEESKEEQDAEDAGDNSTEGAAEPSTEDKSTSRLARFKALQARQSASRKQNLKESAAETQRLQSDPTELQNLQRKHALASHKLLKADTAAAGDDFERRRAWDWTIDESEKWDRRLAKKERHRNNVAYQDDRAEAHKIYKRQVRDMQPDMEGYEREKAEAVARAAANGGLEIVETEDGEVIAIDRAGTFYTTDQSREFVNNRPDKQAVDRLVGELKKADEVREKKRRARGGRADDGGDVTYINEKNKQFNQKLARFYDKYTSEIRESFERGTAM